MAFFHYEGRSVYYEEFGCGEPLLFLHGNTASSRMFSGFAERYGEHFRVMLVDFLGHGRSDRLTEFPADLWFYEAQQVVALLGERGLGAANIIGGSGGALVAMNVALEAPELVAKVIADSFEGEVPLREFTGGIVVDRERSKHDEGARSFYEHMHGDDWEDIVNNDTSAIVRHVREVGRFFHRDLSCLQPDILLTGSRQDEFVGSVSPTFFEETYDGMLAKMGHGRMHLFDAGGHPAMLSNQDEFYTLSRQFLG